MKLTKMPMDWKAISKSFLPDSVGRDRASIKKSIANRLLYSVGKDPITAHTHDWLNASALVARDRLVERWMDTSRAMYRQDAKRIYYLSVEFLVGRALTNSLLATGLYDECRNALEDMGLDINAIEEEEMDAALGNGGLGRLAACFLDSMATLALPGYGYGIRYDYGMFAQGLNDGWQVEFPDNWLAGGNPWEFPRPDVAYPVKFGGEVIHQDGKAKWVEDEQVLAMAYDSIVPGYGTKAVNTLRLWSARSSREVDLSVFNQGRYTEAVEEKNQSENVTRVLYPDDSTDQGRELRLRQEYFFVSASLQDILRRFLSDHDDWDLLPDSIAIHLNDTHPALAVPELLRLLIDEHGLDWDKAWSLTTRIFSYTNHTLMPEALETWSTGLLQHLLPRIMEIILVINAEFLDWVRQNDSDDPELLRRVSLIEEDHEQRVRMGNLSVVASHKVNGVSVLHSELVRTTLFPDYARLFPDRFVNVTNGITPRRWLNQANPDLAALIDTKIGDGWREDLGQLSKLAPLADDAKFRTAFREVKSGNKARLALYIADELGIEVDPASLFDIQIKRIHEYKRQLLNLLHVVARYNRIKAQPEKEWVPRTVIFAGKAASAYWMAKLIIKLTNDIAATINNDPDLDGRLKVAFLPNYSVTLAELIIPAADLSEQISTAGTEASGTGNMKLALNGALTIGTADGANIEIRDAVGEENIFIFGKSVDEVSELRANGYDPQTIAAADPLLQEVLQQIGSGRFSPDEPERFRAIGDSLLQHGDHYMLLADFADYLACQSRADALFQDPDAWDRQAILNVSAMGTFSSDRSIQDYADAIWGVRPLKI